MALCLRLTYSKALTMANYKGIMSVTVADLEEGGAVTSKMTDEPHTVL